MKLLSLAMIFGLMIACTAAAPAVAAPQGSAEVKAVTVKGEIIDLGCYLASGAKGPAELLRSLKCIQSGMPMGLLTADGALYVLVPSLTIPDPFTEAKKHVSKTVEILGPVHERNGIKALEVKSVKQVVAAG